MKIKKSIKQEENRSNGFIITYDWLMVLPPAESVMLAYLIDAEDICEEVEEYPGYFMCTSSFIQSRCVGWSNSNITTALNNLESKNIIFLKNKRSNEGNARCIHISRDAIKVLKDKYKSLKSHN